MAGELLLADMVSAKISMTNPLLVQSVAFAAMALAASSSRADEDLYPVHQLSGAEFSCVAKAGESLSMFSSRFGVSVARGRYSRTSAAARF